MILALLKSAASDTTDNSRKVTQIRFAVMMMSTESIAE
jgi:hypothetical protein